MLTRENGVLALVSIAIVLGLWFLTG